MPTNDDSFREVRLRRLEDRVDLERLCIPLSRCVNVVPGPIDAATLEVLETRGYDQAPVSDLPSHHYRGLVETTYLRSLLEAGRPLSADDPAICAEDCEVHTRSWVTIFDVFGAMADRRAAVVVREYDSAEYGYTESICGLLTISDLNRQPIRGAIYDLLASVESGLAMWLERYAPDPWTWLKHLDEDQQARVLGYWELAKRKGVDVGPIAALTLAQLTSVIGRDAGAALALGYPSRSQFSKAVGRLPRLRNRVMHPVRPLVLQQDDVAEIRRSLLVLDDLRDKIDLLLGKEDEA
jgi:hypothetical protein